MWVLVLVLVAVAAWWRWRPLRRPWWTDTVGSRRAWAARAVGLEPTFGSLQRAVLAEAVRQRTVSVTGSEWLPAALEVDLADCDHEVIAHAPGPFLQDLAEVLTARAQTRGWRLDAPVTVRFADPTDAAAAGRDDPRPGLPTVRIVSVTGHLVGAGNPGRAAPALPPTTRRAGAMAPPTAVPSTLVPHTELVTMDPGAPGLLLEPEDPGGEPIVLGPTGGAVIGRTRPADIVVADPTVSARHCRLDRRGMAWWIEDLGSSNGTIVNGRRLADRCQLATGDVVSLGRRTRYLVRI
jgi:hypothetical protein